jgi:signal transduction histidine kinase
VSSTATVNHQFTTRLFGVRPKSGVLIDALIATVALVGSLSQISHGGIPASGDHRSDLDLLGTLLAALASVPLLAWRRAPMGVFALTAGASVLLAALDYSLGLPLGPTAALFLLAVSRDEEHPWTPGASALVIGSLSAYLGAAAAAQESFPGSELLHTGLAWAVAWFAGERGRLRHEHMAELAERARRTERDAERERLLAVAEERTRIARDLHDSAGHAINVIGVRAGTARMRHDEDPERSRAALEEIEEIARQTVGEIDQIVGTLRDRGSETGEIAAPPGLASLNTLVAESTAGGLEVSVGTAGSPRRLTPAVDRAAYRILQEALTNAARHGTGEARVELAFEEDALQLTITNPLRDPAIETTNGGHGLIGMSERATLLGGSLDTDRGTGGFRLRARLPYGADLQ